MQRKLLLSAVAAILVAAGGLAMAQNAAPGSATPSTPGMARHGAMHGGWSHRGMRGMHGRMDRHGGPVGAVIGDLRQISRLYLMEGKPDQLEGLYKDVLAKTQNPMVRNFAYDALARLQARPRNTSAAIATLRKSLDENLGRLNAMPAGGPGRGR